MSYIAHIEPPMPLITRWIVVFPVAFLDLPMCPPENTREDVGAQMGLPGGLVRGGV